MSSAIVDESAVTVCFLQRVKKLPERRPMCKVHPVCDFQSMWLQYEASTVAYKTIPSPEYKVIPRARTSLGWYAQYLLKIDLEFLLRRHQLD